MAQSNAGNKMNEMNEISYNYAKLNFYYFF